MINIAYNDDLFVRIDGSPSLFQLVRQLFGCPRQLNNYLFWVHEPMWDKEQ